MELEVSYDFENEQQFWDELHEIVSRECETTALIDEALRSYLNLTTTFRGDYINSEYDLARCSYQLHSSPLFQQNAEYVRKQIVHCLLQDDESEVLQIATSFLLADAHENETTFELMNKEGAFQRLVDLISKPQRDEGAPLHRLLMELLYEMSRVQKIRSEDMMHVQDEFIIALFQLIEELSNDVTDPYHYPVIRVILVLNEQFLLATHDPSAGASPGAPFTNKVMKVLSSQGSKFKTFGENIILLLNREDETSLQLLTLKLLYLLFTTPPTYEYFYTNDLRVLVDILIRNLLDLPEDASALRHTYLRVLYPLLSYTQLRHPPQYKRDEIRKLLSILARGQSTEEDPEGTIGQHWGHFGELDETTKRLVRRCQGVAWLADPEDDALPQAESPVEDKTSAPTSPISPPKSRPPALPAPRKLTKRNSSKGSALTIGGFLTPQLETARQSSLSMMEMASQREKPGVITPSRNPTLKHNLRTAIMMNKKEKPPLPKARRSGASKTQDQIREQLQQHDIAPRPVEDEIVNTNLNLTTDLSKLENQPHTSEPPTEPHAESPSIQPKTTPPKKKPPPTLPKARRWRFLGEEGGRGHGHGHGHGHGSRNPNREPGKFNANLPSITTTSSNGGITEVSPFSPRPTAALGRDGASVSTALGEAQAEAISGIGETLERVHITTSTPMTIQEGEITSPQRRTVLAPPSMAPVRAVPGPRWELERSPFLSEEDPEVREEEEGVGQ